MLHQNIFSITLLRSWDTISVDIITEIGLSPDGIRSFGLKEEFSVVLDHKQADKKSLQFLNWTLRGEIQPAI